MKPLVVGTRGSALALAQARLVQAALAATGRDSVIKEIKTVGDRRPDLSLTRLAPGGHGYETNGARLDPGLFTKELEAELLARTISVAAHSLKDLPTTMPDVLTLAAVLPRADAADVLIYKPGEEIPGAVLPMLPHEAMVATSSLRRQRQLQWLRPDLRVSEVRGNVNTRLRKLREHEEWSALVLARAGLERLGYGESLDAGFLKTPESGRFLAKTLGLMLPAVGQGAIGLQARIDDREALEALAAVNCAETMACIRAERELLALLGGGCQMPLGVRTSIHGNLKHMEPILMRMEAILFRPDDDEPAAARVSLTHVDPEELAQRAFRHLSR